MALNKDSIEALRFTLLHRKYYLAAEVDEALDRLILQADEPAAPVTPQPAPIQPAAPVTPQPAPVQPDALLLTAQQQSAQLMAQAAQQRSRALAASRAAYYNALQFKQEIARQYEELSAEMDDALELLRPQDEPEATARPQEP